MRDCFTTLSTRFLHTDLLWAAIATYPGAFWTFGIASKQLDPRVVRRHAEIETRLYDIAAHSGSSFPVRCDSDCWVSERYAGANSSESSREPWSSTFTTPVSGGVIW